MKKILILSPHPDDDILGCGGTIRLHSLKGDKVKVIYLTSGGAGGQMDTKKLEQLRQKEAQQALLFLGENIEHIFLSGEDGFLSRYDKELLNLLTDELRRYQPEVVYLPHFQDGHRDHQETYFIGKEAILRCGANCFPFLKYPPWFGINWIYTYEVWTPLSKYQVAIDITAVLSDKKMAISAHKSQLQNQNFIEGILSLNRYRGVMTGVGEWVEVFGVEKISPLDVLT